MGEESAILWRFFVYLGNWTYDGTATIFITYPLCVSIAYLGRRTNNRVWNFPAEKNFLQKEKEFSEWRRIRGFRDKGMMFHYRKVFPPGDNAT
jgi:hypothetical protein